MDSTSMDFHLLKTSFPVPTLRTMPDTTDKLCSRLWPACLSNHNESQR